jgi:hypothetical protein
MSILKIVSLQHPLSSVQNIELGDDGRVISNVVINEQSGTSYTLSLTDNGKLIKMTSASANTITVPLDSSVNFPIGATIAVVQYGDGTLTVQGASGVTVNSTAGSASASVSDKYAGGQLYKMSANQWLLIGSVE